MVSSSPLVCSGTSLVHWRRGDSPWLTVWRRLTIGIPRSRNGQRFIAGKAPDGTAYCGRLTGLMMPLYLLAAVRPSSPLRNTAGGAGVYRGSRPVRSGYPMRREPMCETVCRRSTTDSTEFHIPAGKVYLSPLIDCFDGLVVSWSIGKRPDAELVNTMLDAAIETVANSDERPVVHSDRGAHYRWPGWLSRIRDARLVRSMSRKGCSPDNAACEGFLGRLKTELFYPRDWRASYR
jgi:transposase InsO family protein